MAERAVLVKTVDTSIYTDIIAAGTPALTGFAKYRSSSVSESVARGAVIEESMDQVAAAEIDGGTLVVSGNIEGALRIDGASQSLLLGAMGKQTVAADKIYKMTQVPQELGLYIIDEQADNSLGRGVEYDGVGISSMEITCNVKEYAKVKWAWIGRRPITQNTALTPAAVDFTTTPMLVFYNATVTFGGNAIKLKGLTLTMDRKFDTDYYFIGSQFLQGLFMNGLTTLGGTFGLGAGEWNLLNSVMNGAAVTADTEGGLDGAHTQFLGLNLNAIPSGALVITFRKPKAVAGAAELTINVLNCMITDMTRSVQGRNMWEKNVTWQAQLSANTDFTVTLNGAVV